MTIQFYGHPFSSYTQKALIALYENGTPFEWRVLTPYDPETGAEFAGLWPLQRFPIIVDGDRTVVEASIVIEYLDRHYPGSVRLIPADADAALEVRMMDRFFDNYISVPLQKIVLNSLRPETDRDSYGADEARAMLDTAMPGWTRRWPRASGLQATPSASPTALPGRRCSMPTGRIRFRRRAPT
jgi:glutathione S-transferase